MAIDSNRKGAIVPRGHTKRGTVVSDRGKKTVIVEMAKLEYFPKYRRYARGHSRVPAHNPQSIGASLGDEVEIAECRKISKTKAWIVTKILRKASGLVVLEKKGAKALEEEAERLKKSEVKRDELAAQNPEAEKKKE
ncbi:MAG: 30S ribosomal protein S17 [Candidatus Micrarchaeota archaeon]|nr:30S ribosomal protein S17 [Candidatus Micrarchaeota archaeon]